MNAFLKFNKGLLALPVPWRVWVALLAVLNVVVPLLYWERAEAKLVLAVMLVNMVLMTVLTGLAGFTRLLGLGHLPWLALLPFLWMRLDQIPAGDFYGLWIRALIGVNGISLVIDTLDVARYIAGDRAETVAGLSGDEAREPAPGAG